MNNDVHSGRFVVVSDEGDWSWTGHNHFYSVSVAEASANDGRETVILAPISAKDEEDAGEAFKIIPYIITQHQLVGGRQALRQLALRILPRNMSPRVLAGLRRSLELITKLQMSVKRNRRSVEQKAAADTFGGQIATAIQSGVLLPTDTVFVHTILTQSLESLLEVLSNIDPKLLPKFCLTLRTDPDEIATRYGRQLELREILARFWSRKTLRDRIVFLTDTEELKAAYEKLSPFAFFVIPIPVAVPPRTPKSDTGPLILTYVGAIRRERGFPLLPKLAGHLASRNYPRPIKLVVQAGGSSMTQDPGVMRTIEELKQYSGLVDVIIGSVPPDRYIELLHDADIVLLPYDPLRYRARSSGVLAEALKLGCPTVVPSDTWMARMAGGSGVAFSAAEGGDAFVSAVDEAITRFPALRAEAARAMDLWRDSATPTALYRAVMAAASVPAGG